MDMRHHGVTVGFPCVYGVLAGAAVVASGFAALSARIILPAPGAVSPLEG